MLSSNFRIPSGGWLLFGWLAARCVCAQPQTLAEAARLDAAGQCQQAEPFYQKALAAPSPSPPLLNNGGNHYLICGQPDKARPLFERLLRLNPTHRNANLQLAAMAVAGRQGKAALGYLRHVPATDPPVPLLRAEALHQAGEPASALRELDALAALPDPRIQAALGALCGRLGLYERAETAFEAVLRQRPEDPEILLQVGRAAARALHRERARSALEVAYRLRPEEPAILLELGLVCAAAGDYPRAVFLLAQARKHAPGQPHIVLALARAAEDAGFYGDAALAHDEYRQLRPADTEARRDRARVLALTATRLDEGMREMAAYASAHPNDPVGHYNLAQFTWKTDPALSLDQLAAALRLDPKFAPAHVSRAWLLHRVGRSADAIPHLEAALQLQPDNTQALDQLGLIYLSLDRAADAGTALRRALKLAPNDPAILLHLGRALLAVGRQDEAQRHLDRYQQLRTRQRDPRRDPGMIEAATLSGSQRREREIERLTRLARARPDDALLQLNLARLLLAEGRTADAEQEFSRLLDQNAEASVREQAGHALVEAGRYALARRFLDPERPSLDLALALFHSDGPQAALAALEKVPESGDALLLRARILDTSGQSLEAQQLLERAQSFGPQTAPAAALLLARHGRRGAALALIERASAAHPEHPELLLTEAMLRRSENLFRMLQSRWPEWDRPYLIHGLLLEAGKRPTEALAKIRTAIALGSQDPEAPCALARLTAQPTADPRCSATPAIP